MGLEVIEVMMMMDFTDHFGKGNTHDLLWI